MLAAVRSAAVHGIDAYEVWVEVDVALGLPQWTVVGLPAGAVKESRERVSAALVNSGFVVPPRRITVNLRPADVRKEGSAFDLPIALGLLVATGQLEPASLDERLFLGELGLDGAVRPIRGALPVARCLAGPGRLRLVLPEGNVAEAALVSEARLAAPPTLGTLVEWLGAGELPAPAATARDGARPPAPDAVDFADVVGQETAKRALEIAAAGNHNVLLVGPPGAGKTMLARRLPTVLPALTEAEALEVVAVHSVAGILPPDAVPRLERPFRAPHHSVSGAGLIGGGSSPRPGEVSLAHHGVLFLDELLEFPRAVLDSLRQPMEDGQVTIARALLSVVYPARFTLVGAMNPCPCGHAGDPMKSCSCAPAAVARYQSRLSGPLVDRIDVHVTVGAVPIRELGSRARGETSAGIRARVEEARARQRRRYARLHATCNAHVSGRWLDAHTPVDAAARELLAQAAERLALSARGYHRVLKVARTVADLDGSEAVTRASVAEALRYRPVTAAGEGAAPRGAAVGSATGPRLRAVSDGRPD